MNAAADAPDDDLFRRYCERRDEAALEALLARHWPRVFRIAWRILGDPAAAEDAAQRAFVKVAARPGSRPGDRFDGFITRIVVNEARDASKARRRRERHEGAAGAARASDGGREGDDDREACAALAAHLERLDDDLRLPLLLHYAEGLTHGEVAEALAIPAGTASSRLRRGLERLREWLGAAGFATALPLEGLFARAPAPPAAPAPPGAAAIYALASLARATRRKAFAAGLGIAAALIVVVFGTASLVRPIGALRAPTGPTIALAPMDAAVPGGTRGVERVEARREAAGPARTLRAAALAAGAPLPRPSPAPPASAPPPLVEGHVLRGTDDGPIAGARIAFEVGTSVDSTFLETRTAPDGAFAISADEYFQVLADGTIAGADGTPQTRFSIAVSAPNMERLSIPLAPAEIAAHEPLVLRMHPGGGKIAGRVVERRSRKPVAGVTLDLIEIPLDERPRGSTYFPLRSDEAGEVRMGGLAPGKVRLNVRDRRFAPASIEVETAASPEPFELEVEVGATLLVEGVEPDGRPATRFAARIYRDGEGGDGTEDAKPRLSFPGLEAGEGYVVHVRRSFEEEAETVSEPISLAPGESRTVRLVVPPAAPGGPARLVLPLPEAARPPPPTGPRSFTGRVLDPVGAPVAGARVSFLGNLAFAESGDEPPWEGGPFLEPEPIVTGRDGRFAFEALPRACRVVRLEVAAAGFREKTIAIVSKEELRPFAPAAAEVISDPGPAVSVEIRLEVGAGFVVDLRPPQDWPADRLVAAIAEANLWTAAGRAKPSRVEVERSGRVRVTFDSQEAGSRCSVTVAIAGCAGVLVEDLAAGSPPFEAAVVEGPGGTLRGRAVFAAGRPAAGALVLVVTGPHPFSPWRVGASEDGNFELRGLPLQPLALEIRADPNGEARRLVADPRVRSDLGTIVLEERGSER